MSLSATVIITALVAFPSSAMPLLVQKHVQVKSCFFADKVAKLHINGLLNSARFRVVGAPKWKCWEWA